jgi:sulfatase maturation enzyme AslB (radical SAM superfamily)
MFNGNDKTYRRVPPIVSYEVVDLLADRIKEQIEKGNSGFPIDITLHGGEPLLLSLSMTAL